MSSNLQATYVGGELNDALLGTANDSAESKDECDSIIQQLGLSQAQVGALLGITPQAVSKACKERGLQFFFDEARVNKLYDALLYIGGNRYAESAEKLKDFALRKGMAVGVYTNALKVHPMDIYGTTGNLLIVSDTPEYIIDWHNFNSVVFSPNERSPAEYNVNVYQNYNKKSFDFLCSSISGANRLAYHLENGAFNSMSSDNKFNAKIRIFITNITKYSGDFVLVNHADSYRNSNQSMVALIKLYNFYNGLYYEFWTTGLDLVYQLFLAGIGSGSNDLSHWIKLSGDEIDKEHTQYLDDLIALRGKTKEEDLTPDGLDMAGGILLEPSRNHRYDDKTLAFNKKMKFTPVFILAYQRSNGDSYNPANEEKLKEINGVRISYNNSGTSDKKSFW